MTDKTIHQPVAANTDGSKSTTSVKDVMNIDVKPVPITSSTVLNVNLTELLLLQIAHVLMVNTN
jgi:hypothetical protein